MRPADHPTANCWYSKIPLGHTKLSKTVARLCASAGIQGHKTNHSLRATTTSRLYHSGVDEQLVMERTGHRSLEGVRSYKRTSDAQREALSDILNRPKVTGTRECANLQSEVLQPTTEPVQHPTPATTQHPSLNPMSSSQLSTLSAATMTQQSLSGFSFPSATFHGCTITFNIGSSMPGSSTERKRKRAILSSDFEDE